jgi:hypothetical protein
MGPNSILKKCSKIRYGRVTLKIRKKLGEVLSMILELSGVGTLATLAT